MKTKLVTLVMFLFAAAYANSQNVDMIINKAISQIGGEKAFKAINSFEYDMTMVGMGMEMPMKIYKKGDDKFRLEMSFMGQDMISILNGNKGWTKTAGNVTEVPEEAINEFKEQLTSQVDVFDMPFMNYKEKGVSFELLGEEPVDGMDAYKIEVISDDANSVIYIDKTTNLLVKASTVQNIGGQDMDADIYMSDYKSVGSLKMPHKVQVKSGGEDLVQVVLNSVKINEDIDDSLFQKP
ncbi:MAG: outer membrane lipoprotein-sorting protein [Ignavibacteria bacterium]|jgi:outer membrane lipoprotein-sorting protein|nr:outer membrane lipoprotein-sorting protein [Ignavibacteria bacterium]